MTRTEPQFAIVPAFDRKPVAALVEALDRECRMSGLAPGLVLEALTTVLCTRIRSKPTDETRLRRRAALVLARIAETLVEP